MPEETRDQAAGLRRLLGGTNSLQVLAFVAADEGVGRSVTVANLGVMLAKMGKEVLIIDEHLTQDNVSSCLGIPGRCDLIDVLEGNAPLSDVLARPIRGLGILSAARAAKKLPQLTKERQRVLLGALGSLDYQPDIILVDACANRPEGLSPFALAAQDVVVVLSGKTDSITEGYALIKKVSHIFARFNFKILVNKVRTPNEAIAIFQNMANVAEQRNIAYLEYAGSIPQDEQIRIATQLRRPVITYAPRAPGTQAVQDLANEILFWQSHQNDRLGVDGFLQQLLHLSQHLSPHLLRI